MGFNEDLLLAVSDDDLDRANECLSSRADVNYKDGEGTTAIIMAVKRNNREMIKLLLEHNADVEIKDKFGNNALSYAYNNKNVEVSKILLWHIELEKELKAILKQKERVSNEERKRPKTVEEAVDLLFTLISDETKQQIKNTTEENLPDLHFGLGAGIRNEFGLWKDNKELLKACGKEHPDDASSVIIKALREKLKDEKQTPSDM